MAHPVGPGAVAISGAPSVSLDPVLLVGLSLSALLYAIGWRRLKARGRGRARPAAFRAGCYGAGLAAVGLATVSPLAACSERLFSAHMVQHLLLAVAAPPLLWLGAPLVPILWGLPRRLRRGLGRLFVPGHPVRLAFRVLTRPVVASLLYVGTLALWHVPAFYDAAQGRTLVHDLEHGLLVATALGYWWPAVYPAGGRRPLGYGATLLYLVAPMLEGDLIGALLSFAQSPLYATYAAIPGADVASVVADQRLGGLVMWVGGGLVWLVPMGIAFFLASRDERAEPGGSARASPAASSREGAPVVTARAAGGRGAAARPDA